MKFISSFVVTLLCGILVSDILAQSTEPQNLDFEDELVSLGMAGWFAPPSIKDYQVKLTSHNPHSGKQCVEVSSLRSEPNGFGNVMQYIDATPYRGKKITYKAYVRSEAKLPLGNAQLWLRVDRTNKKKGFFDNMHDRPIISPVWKEYTITGIVDDDARGIAIGCMMHGEGKIYVDDVSFTDPEGIPYESPYKPLKRVKTAAPSANPVNLDFESSEFDTDDRKGWVISKGLTSYKVKLSANEPHGGKQCAKIMSTGFNRMECGTIIQAIDAKPYRGKRVTVKAFARADLDEDLEGWGSLFLRLRQPGDMMLYNQKGDERIESNQWKEYTITKVVDNDAETIEFGCGLFRQGSVYLDDVSFSCEDCK